MDKQYVETKNKSQSGIFDLSNLSFRLIKTFILFLSWMSLGLCCEIIGPSLPLIKQMSGLNMEQIGLVLGFRGISMLFGASVFGILSDKFKAKRNQLITLIQIVLGSSVFMIPFCRNAAMLYCTMFLSGLAHAAQDTVGNPTIGELWLGKSTGPFNLVHSGYGIGAAISPLILKGQLSQINISSIPKYHQNNTEQQLELFSKIQIPFIIIGSITIFIGSLFIIYFFKQNPVYEFEIENEETNSDFQKNYVKKDERKFRWSNIRNKFMKFKKLDIKRILLNMLIVLSASAIMAADSSKFQFSFATTPISEGGAGFSYNIGFYINSIYFTTLFISRIFIGFVAIKISPKVLIIFELLGVLSFSIIFLLFHNNVWGFFIFSAGFGGCLNTLTPTLLGVINLHQRISGILMFMIIFGMSCGGSQSHYVTAYFISHYGYWTFPYVIFTFSITIGICVGLVLVVTRNMELL